jgi:hypothetical protein
MNEDEAYRIVENFSYKSGYKLQISEAWDSTNLELNFLYAPPVADGLNFYRREIISFQSLNRMPRSLFKRLIFDIVNELEKDIMIKSLKFDGIQYLSDSQYTR